MPEIAQPGPHESRKVWNGLVSNLARCRYSISGKRMGSVVKFKETKEVDVCVSVELLLSVLCCVFVCVYVCVNARARTRSCMCDIHPLKNDEAFMSFWEIDFHNMSIKNRLTLYLTCIDFDR